MPTLLEIYDSYNNGQIKQFCDQVKEYGASDFAKDLEPEIGEGILSPIEAYQMLRRFVVFNDN